MPGQYMTQPCPAWLDADFEADMQQVPGHVPAQAREFRIVLNYMRAWYALKADRRAVSALEYGMIAGMVAAMIGIAFSVIANEFTNVSAAVLDPPDRDPRGGVPARRSLRYKIPPRERDHTETAVDDLDQLSDEAFRAHVRAWIEDELSAGMRNPAQRLHSTRTSPGT